MAGLSFGVVLGGGGAKGLAHLGLLRALREEGVPVDVGGTSQAPSSAAQALHDDPYNEVGSLSQIRLVVRTFCARMSSIWSKVLEITLPHTSYFSGDGFNNVIIRAFGSAKIEDTPTSSSACRPTSRAATASSTATARCGGTCAPR